MVSYKETPNPEMIAELERFVCLLYKSTTHKKVGDLRWHLYSSKAAEGENLPPTLGSLQPHTLRAHFVTMIWLNSNKSHQSLPYPTE